MVGLHFRFVQAVINDKGVRVEAYSGLNVPHKNLVGNDFFLNAQNVLPWIRKELYFCKKPGKKCNGKNKVLFASITALGKPKFFRIESWSIK